MTIGCKKIKKAEEQLNSNERPCLAEQLAIKKLVAVIP